MLDDDAFARAWVESRDRARPRGERAIREELRLKGVDRAVIDVVLSERRDAAHETARREDDAPRRRRTGPPRSGCCARHARALARVADPRQRRQRAYALLARNGFDPETCREVAARSSTRATGSTSDDGTGRGAVAPTSATRGTRRPTPTPARFADALLSCQSRPMKVSPGTSLTPRTWRGTPTSSRIGRSSQP